MTRTLLKLVCAAVLAAAASAGHAQSCSPVSGSGAVTVTNLFSGTNYDAQGSVTFSCSRPPGNPKFPSTFWIGTSKNNNNARTATNGANSVLYRLFRNFAGCSQAWGGNNGITLANALTGNGDRTLTSLVVPFCLRFQSSTQTTKRALSYNATETITVRSTNRTGYNWGTGVLSINVTIDPRCVFTLLAGTLTMSYTSFQAGAATGSRPFSVRCTNGTGYELDLDAVNGTLLGLDYAVGLNTVGTQGLDNLSGTGNAQSYTFRGSIAPSQAGTCANAAGCTGTDPRTITVAY